MKIHWSSTSSLNFISYVFNSLSNIKKLLGNPVSDIKQTKIGVNEMRAVNV